MGIETEQVPGCQLAEVLIDRVGIRDISEAQVMMYARRPDVARSVGQGFQRGHFAGEDQLVIEHCIVQRLDAEAIASHDSRSVARIVNTKGPHAVEFVDHLAAPGAIAVQDDLGIGRRFETATGLREFVPEFPIVVDFAVEHDERSPRGIAHRLTPFGAGLDDRQPGVGKPHREIFRLACPGIAIIWPAVLQPIAGVVKPNA